MFFDVCLTLQYEKKEGEILLFHGFFEQFFIELLGPEEMIPKFTQWLSKNFMTHVNCFMSFVKLDTTKKNGPIFLTP